MVSPALTYSGGLRANPTPGADTETRCEGMDGHEARLPQRPQQFEAGVVTLRQRRALPLEPAVHHRIQVVAALDQLRHLVVVLDRLGNQVDGPRHREHNEDDS